jgi:hypothetical protein
MIHTRKARCAKKDSQRPDALGRSPVEHTTGVDLSINSDLSFDAKFQSVPIFSDFNSKCEIGENVFDSLTERWIKLKVRSRAARNNPAVPGTEKNRASKAQTGIGRLTAFARLDCAETCSNIHKFDCGKCRDQQVTLKTFFQEGLWRNAPRDLAIIPNQHVTVCRFR